MKNFESPTIRMKKFSAEHIVTDSAMTAQSIAEKKVQSYIDEQIGIQEKVKIYDFQWEE